MRFSESFLRALKDRASIAAYAGKLVAWDRKKSLPTKGDYWAPCPFHSEKTASFHVRDQQGSYKCFGCGESGGVLDLAMKLEGLSFPEAVERVAAFAGMPLPEDDGPRDDAEEQRRKRLFAAMGRAQEFFREQLGGAKGREARTYLERRLLPPDVQEQFGIGYAPGGWTDTLEILQKAGFTQDELAGAGLVYAGENDRRAVDVFRDRIMFPIADAQGRIIAFGGRALDPNAKAKYLNSPDTPLFHKGRNLYRLKEARALLAKSKRGGFVVGEGYLDVVAFERAGIAAVAPLGTALTEDQLALVWRAGGEPVFCFDGDGAGRRAADKALDLALPQIGPGRTLAIALMPEGEDPDDVYRHSGAPALHALLAAALPAAEALFERERAREALDSPERKSGFKKRLREAAFRIADEETKKLYLSDLMAKADETLRPVRQGQQSAPGQFAKRPPGKFVKGKFEPDPRATAELKARQAAGPRFLAMENFLREALDRPRIVEKFSDLLARLALDDPDLAAIRDGILDLADPDHVQTVDREALSLHLKARGEDRAAARLSAWPPHRPASGQAGIVQTEEAIAEAEWMAAVTLDVVLPALREEMAALAAAADRGDEAAFERFLTLDRETRRIDEEFRVVRGGSKSGEQAA